MLARAKCYQESKYTREKKILYGKSKSKSSINYLVNLSVTSHATVPIGLAASSWLSFLFVLILSLTCQIKNAEVL